MMHMPIAQIPHPMSSKRVRFESSGLATFLLSIVKRGLRKEGVELVLLQGGGVRGGADYEAGPFTMGDLYKEFGFETAMAIIPLPGKIIAESIKSSREASKPAPNFLHVDDEAAVTDDHVMTAINGHPIDADKIYKVAIYQLLITGLNVIQPLLGYVQENVAVPDEEICRPIKHIAMEVCIKDAWRNLVGMSPYGGPDCTAETSAEESEELKMTVDAAMRKMDLNGDGVIDASELKKMLAEADMAVSLVEKMISMIDNDGDGKISAKDLLEISH